MPISELQRLGGQVEETTIKLKQFTTASMEVGRRQLERAQQLHDLRNKIDLAIVAWVTAHLPVFSEKPDEAQLPALMKHFNTALGHARGIQPRSDAVVIAQAKLFETIFAAKENLRCAFELSGTEIPGDETTP